ncbi:hypothetical protein Q361_10941 [Flavobacterium croceum DSM 17960]|uniref:Uncharacterized protein n=1 Tax=Flavobacterium croceum DSM 17960 TaxID=1121886 RepID=A0A2S4N7E7_9FLAO|nr:hypothetical protein [Flavobacterium croceum]POS01581.1 hypothetical protein Q361_10941 [Flavobacterium croceum DSM 17960]
MYRKKPTPKKRQDPNRFWRLNNWKMWAWLITGIIVFFPLFRFVRKQLQLNKDQRTELDKDKSFTENQNPIVAQKKADEITTRTDIQAAAKSLAHNLGTKYSDANNWYDWLDPRGWTENDKAVADTLIYQRKNFKKLEQLYYSIYTNSRSLKDDVLKLLDEAELKRVRKYLSI